MAAESTSGSSLPLRALSLMAQWNRLARGHVGVSGCISCTCTVAFSDIPMAQLEEDLLEYLQDRHSADPVAQRALAQAGNSLAAVLRAVADGGTGADALHLSALLDDIERWMTGISKVAR